MDKLTTIDHQRQPRKTLFMKHTMTLYAPLSSGLALALTLALWAPGQAFAAEPADGKATAENQMMAHCEEMKAKKQKMKDDAKAQDAELTEQISKMNSAPEDKKVTLMAAVVTHMTEQRIAMDARKAKMEEEMMKHMMQHMQMDKDSMSKCPMMKGMKDMKDMDEKPGEDHKSHH